MKDIKQIQWISIKDQLPDDNNLKVIRYSCDGKHVGIALSRWYIPSNMNEDRWCFEFSSTQGAKVTHWMPLPKPPKED